MKNNLLKVTVLLPFILSLGCNEPDNSSNTPPNAGPKVHLSLATSLAISDKALLLEQLSSFQVNGLNSNGLIELEDASVVSAIIYSDASCSTPIQQWSNGAMEILPIRC